MCKECMLIEDRLLEEYNDLLVILNHINADYRESYEYKLKKTQRKLEQLYRNCREEDKWNN